LKRSRHNESSLPFKCGGRSCAYSRHPHRLEWLYKRGPEESPGFISAAPANLERVISGDDIFQPFLENSGFDNSHVKWPFFCCFRLVQVLGLYYQNIFLMAGRRNAKNELRLHKMG